MIKWFNGHPCTWKQLTRKARKGDVEKRERKKPFFSILSYIKSFWEGVRNVKTVLLASEGILLVQ